MAGSMPSRCDFSRLSFRHALLLLALFSPVVGAQTERVKAADLPMRYDEYRVRYDVNADGTFVKTLSVTKSVLKESALHDAKDDRLSFSASIEKGEVVDAWTQKKDGKRIAVPKDNYQLHTASGRQSGNPFFSDRNSITVVFPDVAVGDQVHVTWRLESTEAIFPGQFSLREMLSRYMAVGEGELVISVPAALKAQHKAWNLQEEKPVTRDGRRTHRWTWRNPEPDKWKYENSGIDVLADEPQLLFSTLSDYRQLVDAYGQRARPKAAVTERIRQLALSLTTPEAKPEDKARAFYEWIQKNITYGGNCIGIGAVVPRDLDVVLDNRIGDCKDRATLLQALLAAVGIESTQALINSGSLYDLPEVPVVSNVNHVINYLPALNLYLDSTSSVTPFGRLPFGDSDKPVLHVDNYRTGTRTPPDTGADSRQRLLTRLKVNADGSATGEVEISASGQYAVVMRRNMRDMTEERLRDFVKERLKGSGFDGSGKLEADPVTSPAGDYKVRATLEIKDFLEYTEAGAFRFFPLVSGPATVFGIAGGTGDEAPTRPRPCVGGGAVEEYVIEMPTAMNILYMPKSRTFKGGGLNYSATYARQGNTLTLTRSIESKVERNVCAPAQLGEQQKLARDVKKEIRSQVLYQQTQ